MWENLFLPLTPSRRYAQSISRGGQLCQLLCPDSPIAIMRHDVTKPDSGILPKLMIALNGLATRQERDRWSKFPEEPRQIGTRTRSKMFNRSDRSFCIQARYQYDSRIYRDAFLYWQLYLWYFLEYQLFVDRLLLFCVFYILYLYSFLLRCCTIFSKSFLEWNFSRTLSIYSSACIYFLNYLKFFLQYSYIFLFSLIPLSNN